MNDTLFRNTLITSADGRFKPYSRNNLKLMFHADNVNWLNKQLDFRLNAGVRTQHHTTGRPSFG